MKRFFTGLVTLLLIASVSFAVVTRSSQYFNSINTSGDITVGGDAHITENANITGDVHITGTLEAKNTLIKGTLTATNDATMQRDLLVTRDIHVTGTGEVGDFLIRGDLAVTGTTEITLSQILSGNLSVEGTSWFGNNAEFTGKISGTTGALSSWLTVAGTMGVIGKLSAGDIQFTGVSTLQSLVVSKTASFDDTIIVNANLWLADDKEVTFGNLTATPDARVLWETADADAHYLSTVLSGSNNYIISADNGIDWTHAASTNPKLFIQSSDEASVNEYVGIEHNAVDGVITTGSGLLYLNPSTTLVAFGGNTTGFPLIRSAASSQTAAAISYVGDQDTGSFWVAADSMALTAGGEEMLTLVESTSDELVVNQDQADIYFRVESDTRTQALLVDAAGEFLTIGNGTKSDGLVCRFPREITTTNEVQATVDSITLLDENTYQLSAYVIGVRSTGADRAGYHIEATAYRTGAGAATLQGTVTSIHAQESNATWGATFTVSGNDVRLSVTGTSEGNVEWTGTLKHLNMSN